MGKLIDNLTGKPLYFDVVETIERQDSGRKDKTLVLQRLRFQGEGQELLRLGYYIDKGQRKTWGQYSPMVPPADLKYLMDEARKRNWPI